MSKTLAVYVGVAVATLIGHYTLNTQRHMTNLEVLVRAADQKERIQADQIRELIAGLQQANQKNETLKTEGYVAGVSDAINKPDYYMAIWHQGYDRGSAVQADVIKAGYRPSDLKESSVPTPLEPVAETDLPVTIPVKEKK
jgi:hypothetical protein